MIKNILTSTSVFAMAALHPNIVATLGTSSSPAASLSIDIHGDDGRDANGAFTAPVAVHFEARPTGLAVSERTLPPPDFATTPGTSQARIYDEAFHEITYIWRLVSYPVGYRTTFENGLNVPDIWNDRTVAYGKQVAFCFDVPGDYTIECWAVDEAGASAVASVTFSSTGDRPAIADPDSVFGGGATICINPAGDSDFSWAPAGAQTFYADGSVYADDVSAVRAAFGVLFGTSDSNQSRRILFKNGATFDLSTEWEIYGNSSFWSQSRIHIGAPLSGDPAIIQYRGSLLEFSSGQRENIASVAVYNIDARGGWDETGEAGKAAQGLISNSAATCYTYHRYSGRGASVNIGLYSNLSGFYNLGVGCVGPITFSECTSTSWRAYGAFFNPIAGADAGDAFPDTLRVGFIGFKCARSIDAITEDDPNAAGFRYNDSGPIRFAHFDKVYFGVCDFFSNDPKNQPCMRGMNNPFDDSTPTRRKWAYVSLDRVVGEAGSLSGFLPSAARAGTNNPGVGLMPANTVLDKILYVAGPKTVCFAGTTANGFATGVTMRNFAVVVPPATNAEKSFNGLLLLADTPNSPSDPEDALIRAQPVRVFNGSVINLRTSAQNNGGSTFEWYPAALASGYDITLENCVDHRPNLGLGAIDAGPFIASPLVGFTPRGGRRRWNFERFQKVLPEVPPGGTFIVPYAEIPDQDMGGNVTGRPGQTYWTVDHPDHNYHYIYDGPSGYLDVDSGDLGVAYGASEITFTNLTGAAISAGTYRIFIDRRALLSTDTTHATSASLNMSWIPAAGSSALNAYSTGLLAHADLLGNVRSGKKDPENSFSIVGGTAELGAFEA